MDHLTIPKGYESALNLHETQVAIKVVKDFFQNLLAERLNLLRVSAPLFVDPTSGLNDNLNGVERPVSFDILEQQGREAEVVQSLAKWKRFALKKYGFSVGEGLYTDMSAIRRDEITDNIHSIYVDQWDWEKIIRREDRTMETLKSVVRSVYRVLRKTEKYMSIRYDYITEILPDDIFFTTIAFVKQLWIILHVGRARFTWMGFFPRAYADLAECGFAGGLRGHIDRVRRVHQRSSASSNSCTNGSS